MLRFAEDACVQCGLCEATCPEKVITLKPQLDFRAATRRARILKEEEPFCCIRCGKPFGVKSTIERVAAKLEGKHWMYSGSRKRLDVIKMCDDCRVAAVAEQGFDPYGANSQTIRTTEDYLREREAQRRRDLTRISASDLAITAAMCHPGTTGNFSLCKPARACASRFRCAFTSSGGVSASH